MDMSSLMNPYASEFALLALLKALRKFEMERESSGATDLLDNRTMNRR